MAEAHLRFAPEILQRLGEELIPHPDLGIVELVRNAYDADAKKCIILLDKVDKPGGTITVTDNGDGMTAAQVMSGWLLLGKSGKTGSRLSRTGRQKVGEKGLGRLGALRLGSKAELTTWPRRGSDTTTEEVSLALDWDKFEQVEAVEDVRLMIDDRKVAPRKTGTKIVIEHLRGKMGPTDVRRLARSLVLLTGPFPAANTFAVELQAPQFSELEKLVREAYFAEYEFKLEATLNEAGFASARLTDWRGRVVGEAGHDVLSAGRRRGELVPAGRYETAPATFELYQFNLGKTNFEVRRSVQAVSAVQEWLKVVGGVHLFQRGLRVQPYGDPGYDWLDLNLRRARSPEVRPSTNNAVGRVVIESDDAILIQKTDRTGFIENDAFAELKRFGGDVLEWSAATRERLRDREREEDRDRTKTQVRKATARVERSVKELPEQVRPAVERAIEQYQAAVGRQLRNVEDDLLLYRTLATVGTTTAVFAHETLRPLAAIESIAQVLSSKLRHDLPAQYDSQYSSLIARMTRSASSMRTFAETPLRLLSRRKRRRAIFDLNRVVRDMVDLFTPYVDDAGVKVSVQLSSQPARVTGPAASAEAILSNLIANAIYFLGESESDEPGQLFIRTSSHGRSVVLTVGDSGPGLKGIKADEVWAPGRTTREEGTGLGLTIVRDAARDMGGTVHCLPSGELGGAEFNIEFPVSDPAV